MSTPGTDAALAVVEQALRALDPAPVLLQAGSDAATLAAEVRSAASDGALIGALGVLDDLAHVAPLVDALRDAAAAGATVVLTVPNTPYTGRGTAWGTGGAEELRSLLGPGEVALQVTGLTGAALVAPDEPLQATGLSADVPAQAVPVLAVLALGPRAAELAPAALVVPQDLAAERATLRALKADLAFLEARVAELTAQLDGVAPAPLSLDAGAAGRRLPA